jgi:hypothetical protein
LTGSCTKGDACAFSHDLSKYPCKFFWGPGTCLQGNNCRFSHNLPPDIQKINEFIKDNEDFLIDAYNKTQKTQLGQYLFDYLNNKQREENKESFLIPPNPTSYYRPPP